MIKITLITAAIALAPFCASAADEQYNRCVLAMWKTMECQKRMGTDLAKVPALPKLREPAGTSMPVTGPEFFAHEYDPAELIVERNAKFCARDDISRAERVRFCMSI